MKWSVLLLVLHSSDATAGEDPLILYGCMFSQTKLGQVTKIVTTFAPVDADFAVYEWRFEIDGSVVAAVRADLAAGQLRLATFGIPNLPSLSTKVDKPLMALQPQEDIARQQKVPGSGWGVPPGFIAYPTLVESFPLTPPWSPPPYPAETLVSTPTSVLPAHSGRATLTAMRRLSGLPFDQSYAERVNRFEIMERPAGKTGLELDCRVLSAHGTGQRAGFQVLVGTKSAVDLHVVAKIKGEAFFESIYKDQLSGGFSVPLSQSPNTIEVRAFHPRTGDLISHELVRSYSSLIVNTTVAASSAAIGDELTRRAPPGRRDSVSTVGRFTTEIWNIGQSEARPDDSKTRMRTLVGLHDSKSALAEWFPVGIGGELDVVARLVDWANEPAVEEFIIVDPFLSPPTFTRLIRRIGRQDLKLTTIASLAGEDPDQFGKAADAVQLLKEALDQHAAQFACQLRVLNVVEGRQLPDGTQKVIGQAFHDRYVILRLRNGSHRVCVLTNSLNKAAGNWPFALSELNATVAGQVNAYVDGLLALTDLATGLSLIATLDWTNTHAAQSAQSAKPVFGPKLTGEMLQTLAWLLGDPEWRVAVLPMARMGVRRPLFAARRKGLLLELSPRLSFETETVTSAMKRQSRRDPPRTSRELATLLLGLGAICAWSHVAVADVANAFSPYSIRRLLTGALRRAFEQIPLTIDGTPDFDHGSLWDLRKGRDLAWRVNDAMGVSGRITSPDYRISGAINIALATDPAQTIRFVEAAQTLAVREFGLRYILTALSEYSDLPPFPAVLDAQSLVLRTAAALFMSKSRIYGGAGYSPQEIEFALRRWDLSDRIWGLVIGFDSAMLGLRQARGRADLLAIQVGETRASDIAAAVSLNWPSAPADELLDEICDVLDWRSEDIVRLAGAIEQHGHAVDGLWRRLLGRVDRALGMPPELTSGFTLDQAIDEARPDDLRLPGLLTGAIAYVFDTRNRKLTTNATRFSKLMSHCWAQAQDPLFRSFRQQDWQRRVQLLIGIYTFVYRILDEADRKGVTNGAAYFARDLGGRVDDLLVLLEGYAEDKPHRYLFNAERVLLARDRCRYDKAGMATLGPNRPKLVDGYLIAVREACASPPDFAPLIDLVAHAANNLSLGKAVVTAVVADVAETLLNSNSATSDLDSWWRAAALQPEFTKLELWSEFVTDFALHRSDAQSPEIKAGELMLGVRFGP